MREGRGRRTAAAAACAIGLAALTAGSGGATLAAFTDYAVTDVVAGAGVWAPDPPADCGPVGDYAGIVWGTPGDDELVGDDRPRIYLGLGGDDVLTSSIAADCLVGGAGRDVLVGNAATILVGDPRDLHVWQPDAPRADDRADAVRRPQGLPASPSAAGPGPTSPPGTTPREQTAPPVEPSADPPAQPPAAPSADFPARPPAVTPPAPASQEVDPEPPLTTPADAPVKDQAPDTAATPPLD